MQDDASATDPRWVLVADIARELGVSVPAVHVWITEVKVPAKRDGRRWLVDGPACRELRAKTVATQHRRRFGSEPDAPVEPAADPTSMTRRELWASRLRALHTKIVTWESMVEPPGAYRDCLTEFRHAEKAFAAAEAEERALRAGDVDRLPVAEQLARVAARVPQWPDVMLRVVLAEAARRYQSVLVLERDGERRALGPDGEWTG